jgi:aminoglycoside phosphotransferase (APT) family kinase protein
MERIEAPLLKDVAGQLPGETSYLPTTPWSNAGAWLRRYHELQPEQPVATVRAQPEDVRLQLMAYRELLHEALGRSHFVDDVVDKLLTASESLPRDIRLGLSHGDFVAQNTFVHGDGSVSVIDAFPSRRVPVYEDLGRMMVGARLLESSTTRPAYGTPSARPRLHEVALLAAYFGAGNGVPVGRMRFFLALCTLDRWADSLSKQPRNVVRRGLRGSRMTVVNHWYRRELGVQMEMLLPQDRLYRDSWL